MLTLEAAKQSVQTGKDIDTILSGNNVLSQRVNVKKKKLF